jgi:Cof subfamily protein (haloacid dehalogenase superfamily)/HAD superfamily hydrolase (TIGR01509 family)
VSIKVLIADVDGTMLTRDKVLTARTVDAVDRLRAAGILFTITSGRPPRALANLVERLSLTAPVAAFNGGVYLKPDLTTVLAQRTVHPAVAAEAVDYLLQAGLDVWVYRGTEWYLRNPDAFRVARERSNVGFEPVVVDDLDGLLDGAIKIVGVSEDRSLVERCEAELGARLAARASAARSTPFYLDITHPEANKGMVVRQASRILGIPLEQIATIGDMPNDIHMLSIVGLGIAMGNSNDDVKRAARHVTASNDEEGFAHGVDTFILGQPPLMRTPLGLPPRTRACLFELDGVLTQIAKLEAEAWKQLFDEYLRARTQTTDEPFVPFDAVHDYTIHLDGKPHLEGVASFLASRDIELPDNTLRALIGRQGEILRELLRHERAETYEGSVRYLRAARDAGFRTAVVSSSKRCADVLEAAGIADLFDARIDGVVAAREHLAEIPAPDTYLAATQAIGVEPEQAAVFEDSVSGVKAGRIGHFAYIVGVDRLGRGAELRRHGADVVVPDLGTLMRQA